jgi:multidrug efflux system outer membrane protein
MRILRFTVSAIAILSLAGCANLKPAQISLPETWQATQMDPAQPLDVLWWRNFQSAEMNQLITDAVADNHDLKIAYARVLQSRAAAVSAGASLLPTVSAGGGVTRRESQNGATSEFSGSTSYNASLQASYQLDLFGEGRSSAASAEQRLQSSMYDRETVTITMISSVVTTYLQVLAARERQQLTSDRLKNAEAIFQLLETQRRVGVLSELELAQQRAALANQRAALPALRITERQALNNLAVLLGRNPQGFDVAGRSLSELQLPIIAAGIPSTLLVRRPDLRSAEAALKAASLDVDAARAARLPGIQLTASGGTASAALSNLFSAGTFAYTFGGSLSQTLFAGGRLLAQEQGSRARYQEVAANYERAVISAFSDVEDALTAVDQNGQQFTLATEASTQADLAYRLAELRYRAGVVDFQTVLNAQNQAFQSQESLVQNRLARFNAIISLTLALGGGWDGALPETPSLQAVYNPL